MVDEKRGVVYGAGRDILKSIETIELGNGNYYVRPDETKDRVQKSNEYFDYSHSAQGGNFKLISDSFSISYGDGTYKLSISRKSIVNFANDVEHLGRVDGIDQIFSVGQLYEYPYGWHYTSGTNKGDVVVFQGTTSGLVAAGNAFVSGWGDDFVTVNAGYSNSGYIYPISLKEYSFLRIRLFS